MPNKRIDIGWLRVFDEAVKRGSLSAAATALGTTQPAVSYQIKRIETELGFDLLRRSNTGVELTPEGQALHEVVARAVSGIDDMANRARSVSRPSVRLRADYGFSSLWLVPRMAEFRRAHADVEVQVAATQRHAPEEVADTDVVVVFGDMAAFPSAAILLPEVVVPVCSPRFADEFGPFESTAALTRTRLVHLDTPGQAPWLEWRDYFGRCGVNAPLDQRGARFNTYALVAEAAISGQGVALGWMGLIDSYLRAGLLRQVGETVETPGRGYLLIPPRRRTPGNEALVSWMRSST